MHTQAPTAPTFMRKPPATPPRHKPTPSPNPPAPLPPPPQNTQAPDCPNIHEEAPCPNEPQRSCIVWSAGAFLPRGAEVCNGYKWMSNDRSMLQYGFLQVSGLCEGGGSVPMLTHSTP